MTRAEGLVNMYMKNNRYNITNFYQIFLVWQINKIDHFNSKNKNKEFFQIPFSPGVIWKHLIIILDTSFENGFYKAYKLNFQLIRICRNLKRIYNDSKKVTFFFCL